MKLFYLTMIKLRHTNNYGLKSLIINSNSFKIQRGVKTMKFGNLSKYYRSRRQAIEKGALNPERRQYDFQMVQDTYNKVWSELNQKEQFSEQEQDQSFLDKNIIDIYKDKIHDSDINKTTEKSVCR